MGDMVIEIDLRATPASVELARRDDFTAFKVMARGLETDIDGLASALGRLGRVAEDGHVFVPVQTLHALAGQRGDERDWRDSLEGMLSYARARGWIDDAGAIRATVEWTG